MVALFPARIHVSDGAQHGVPRTQEEVQHEVQDGESLYKIVKVKYPEQMCSLDDVRKANNLPEGAPLSIGQRIRIPNCGKNI